MNWLGTQWRSLVRAKWAPTLATGLITIGATITTAMLGLVLEEWLPTSSSQRTFTLSRLVVLVISGCVLALGLRIATSRSRGFGTLLYVRLLPENVQDWHYAAVDHAEGLAMDFRSATSWFGHRDPAHALDLRREVAQLSLEIERATNDDAHDTGFTLAPNVVFPAGLFVGWNWEPVLGARLEDFNFNRPLPAKPHELAQDASTSRVQNRRLKRRTDAIARGFTLKLEPKGGDHDRPLANPRYVENRDLHVASIRPEDVRSVWLHIHLTQFAADSAESIFGAIPQAGAVDVQRLVAVFRNGAVTPVIAHGDDWNQAVDPGVHDLHSRDLGDAVAYWIRRTLLDYPHAVIVLSGRITKTAQLIAGWYLATRDLPLKNDRSAAAYPWQRIVPMWYDEGGQPQTYRPVWAYVDQINPDILLCRAGLSISGEGSCPQR